LPNQQLAQCLVSKKIYVLTQFNSASLIPSPHRRPTTLSAGFGRVFVEVLAAQQTPD